MSSHDNHDNHSNEPKAVSFTVPFILASVTLVLIFLFLSLCDPTGHDEHATEANEHHVESKDTMAVESPVPTATDSTHKEVAPEAHH